MLEAGRPRGPALEPGEGLLPQAGLDEARHRASTTPGVADAGARPPARAADGDEALRQRDHGGPDLAEARAAERARSGCRRRPSRSRPAAPPRSSWPTTRRTSSGRSTSASSTSTRGRRAAPTSTIPTSCGSTSTRRPASSGTPCAARRWSCATCSPSTGCAATRRRRARRASTSTCGSSRGGTSSRSAAPRWRWRARSSAARPTWRRRKWWKEERHGVFVDYNQNARDRTVASCYSVRPTPDARVSCALRWDEVPDVEPAELRLDTVPDRLRALGDPAADIDERPGSLDPLLDLARRDEEERPRRRAVAAALPQAAGEPKRVQPSRDRDRPEAARPRRRPAARRPAARREHRRHRSAGSAPSPGPARATRTSSTTSSTWACRPGACCARGRVRPSSVVQLTAQTVSPAFAYAKLLSIGTLRVAPLLSSMRTDSTSSGTKAVTLLSLEPGTPNTNHGLVGGQIGHVGAAATARVLAPSRRGRPPVRPLGPVPATGHDPAVREAAQHPHGHGPLRVERPGAGPPRSGTRAG